MGEKKKTLNIGSLIRSIGFINEIIMKLPSLVTLMSLIVFRDLLESENLLMDLWMNYGKVGVLMQEWCCLDLVWVVIPSLNIATSYVPQTLHYRFLDVSS